MAGDVTIRQATPKDRGRILELLAATFGRGGLVDDARFWSWKHERSPFGASPTLVAEAGRELVALRTFLRWSWRSGEEELRAVRAVDTATRPDWQGHGLFRRLTLELVERLQREGISFVFNTPNPRSLPGYLSMGWRKVGRVPVWVRTSRPLSTSLRLLRGGPTGDEGAPLEPSDRLPSLLGHPALPALAESAGEGNGRFQTVRTRAYLDWRYHQIPRIAYDARWQLEGEASAAVVFRRKLRRGLEELMLSEVLASLDRRSIEAAARLIEDAVATTAPDVATAVAAHRTPEAAALRRAGFVAVPRIGPVLVIRRLREPISGPSPLRWSSWRCSLGDLELL